MGAGALGSILAAHLYADGYDVRILARGRRAEQIAQDGLRIRGLHSLDLKPPLLASPAQISGADLLILTMKTYDIQAAIDSLPSGLTTVAMSVANGVLKNAQLSQRFGVENVLGCMANTSGELLADGEVQFTRNECLHLGALDDGNRLDVQEIAAAFERAGVRARQENNIEALEWSKFVAWTALMSISVTTRLNTAAFLANPHCAALACRIMREMAQLAVAKNIEIIDIGPLPVASITAATIRDGRDQLVAIGRQWQTTVPDHRMSSLQDLERGKRLEFEETLGYALDECRRLALPCSSLADCYALVAGINTAQASS